MQNTAIIAEQLADPVNLIPTPDQIRVAISQRYAELAVLRRLLKAAETRSRLCPAAREAAARG